MNLSLLIAVLAAALGWAAVGLSIGLWVGERGRRQAAERLLTFGSPEGHTGAPTSERVNPEAEDRLIAEVQRFSEDTVERATRGLMEQAKMAGYEGYTEAQAKRDALDMLHGIDVEG